MTLYMIRDDTVTAYASAPARASEDELRVRSAKEIETSGRRCTVAAAERSPPRKTAFDTTPIQSSPLRQALVGSRHQPPASYEEFHAPERKPQCYRETTGFGCATERECGHGRRGTGPIRRTPSCAFTLSMPMT